jgi:hypothetical protein
VLGCISSAADEGVDEAAALRAEVGRLVAELDAPQSARRNEAERRLGELGGKIADSLPPDTDDLTAETRLRLQRVRERIKATANHESVAPDAGTVHLGGAKTLGAALEAISRDSRIEFDHPLDGETAVTPFSSPLPFWHALDFVLDESGLDIDYYGGDSETMRLRPRPTGRPSRVDSATYSGIFRLEPTIVTSRRVLRRGDLSGLNVELELAWKPGVTPIGVTLPLDRLSATLDDGQVIKSQAEFGTIDIATGREIPVADLRLAFQMPSGKPTTIITLAGQIRSMLPGKTHRFEFPLATISATQSSGAVTVRLEDVRKNGDLHEIRLGVEFDSPGDAMESHRRFLVDNDVFVRNAGGNRVEHLGYQLYRQSESGIGIGYLFDVGPSASESTLVYETPTAVIKNEIDFLIRDVPLP